MRNLKRAIILWSLIFTLSCSLLATPTDMIYLIPEGYTGGVFILYDENCNTTAETLADGTIIYRIPKDGLLIIKPPLSGGPYNFRYFYVDENDKRTEIKYLEPTFEVRKPSNTNLKPDGNITEEERDTKIFTMNHRRIGFRFHNTPMLLFAFSIGYPKDGTFIYNRTLDRFDKIETEIEKKRQP